ncbi:MAG: hypothetical protein D5R98_00140 [Desulfonatronovibrio sp. MSAO_Bac4]|nr:MAG: hypothetical protein D5R98_00140 [Desulfonatronovibrio sp. MSAO_Bac4]
MSKKFILLLLIMFIAGCANMQRSSSENSYEPLETYPVDDQITTGDDVAVNDSHRHRYYDFDDIPVPNEMKIDTSESILFESQNIKAGSLTFTGRVDPDSLFSYFQVAMQNEGWRPLSYIRYGSYILTFDKPDKLCIIRIIERSFRSELQIWVSPKISPDN